ncbi:MAG TPA: type II secretion system protein [Vicinamibacterales bacterium]
MTELRYIHRVPREHGFTLIELLIVIAIVGILAAVAMAGYRHARITGSEAAAIAGLAAINQAQFAFSQTCGNQRYSPTLTGLGAAHPATGEAFLSADMTMDPLVKSGYVYVMSGTPAPEAPQTCNGLTPVSSYRVSADPAAPGVSGVRYFGTNTDRVIFADTTTFDEDMPERGAPGHGTEVK